MDTEIKDLDLGDVGHVVVVDRILYLADSIVQVVSVFLYDRILHGQDGVHVVVLNGVVAFAAHEASNGEGYCLRLLSLRVHEIDQHVGGLLALLLLPLSAAMIVEGLCARERGFEAVGRRRRLALVLLDSLAHSAAAGLQRFLTPVGK